MTFIDFIAMHDFGVLASVVVAVAAAYFIAENWEG